MLLGEIFPGVSPDSGGVDVSGLAFDDRSVSQGSLFFCVVGMSRDGHEFAATAIERGAAAIVVERPLGLGVPEVVVPNARAAMGPAAARFHGEPSNQLDVVGVTGTNGKTTTAWLVRSLLESCGRACGLVGTVATLVGGDELPAVRTTPEAIELQGLFSRMVDSGDTAAAIEVSSHALSLGRVDGTRFAAGIFTNLTQDHLDFHGTMEAYWQAKKRLFTDHQPTAAIVNVDDPRGAELAVELPGSVSFSTRSSADWFAQNIELTISGSRFNLVHPDGSMQVRSLLPGMFNVSNALAALAAVVSIGVNVEAAVEALAVIPGVPGRFEVVTAGQPFAVLVDYAHTPDSLDSVLRAARALTDGRVICVVGCGGDRDRGKRPLMGGIASDLADVAIITSDNPRSEDPEAIVQEVAAGAAGRAEVIIDRADAISRAVSAASAGDVVLVAGKGHEQGQEFEDGRKIPFDDREVARAALAELGWSR